MVYSNRQISAFRYWIQGYQNFYEPIVEGYFRVMDYRVVRRPASVTPADIQRVITALFDGAKKVGPALDRQKVIGVLERRKRLQPDLLLEKEGHYYLAELKSWGGYRSGKFDLATLRAEFLAKPEQGAFFLLDWLEACGPIAGKILVVSSSSAGHDDVLALLRQTYQSNIELLYLDELLRTPQLAGFIDDQLRYLDAAVAELKRSIAL
jgi:hypothetical protein